MRRNTCYVDLDPGFDWLERGYVIHAVHAANRLARPGAQLLATCP